jgi:hypothetical protein
MSTTTSIQPVGSPVTETLATREVRVYSQSMIFYWWPIWVVGYLLAALTYFGGYKCDVVAANGETVIHGAYFYPNGSIGVIFVFTMVLVFVMTHYAVRGVASLTVIIAAIAVTLFLAYMNWWDAILEYVWGLRIYVNLSFYLILSTGVFLLWLIAVFIVSRLDYYVFRPGQLVHVSVFGGAEEAFDTRGLTMMKLRGDLFRHWILGLGSGDLNVAATGARKAEFTVHNVLFIDSKLARIQHLIAMKPGDQPEKVFTAGEPG